MPQPLFCVRPTDFVCLFTKRTPVSGRDLGNWEQHIRYEHDKVERHPKLWTESKELSTIPRTATDPSQRVVSTEAVERSAVPSQANLKLAA